MAARAIQHRLLTEHAETLHETIEVGRTVARSFPAETASEPAQLRERLATECADRGLATDYLTVLRTAAAEVDESIGGSPVPAPPYLTITSRGPVARATLSNGARLVVALELFAVERDPPRYRFRDPDPVELPSVECR